MAGGGKLRPLGFFVLTLGFGLRLDSRWQGLAWLVLAAGAILATAGLLALALEPGDRAAFVPPEPKR